MPPGSDIVPPGAVHKPTLSVILAYLPAVITALQAAASINSEVGHETVAQIVMDSIKAGAAVAGEIPETHVQTIGAIVSSMAPSVVAGVKAAQGGGKA